MAALNDAIMKVQVALTLIVSLAALEIRLTFMQRQHVTQAGDLRRSHMLGSQASRHALQRFTHIEQFKQLLHRELYHPGSHMWYALDQPMRFQSAHRFP